MDMSSFSLVITFFSPSQSSTSVTHEKHPLERSDSWGASRVVGVGGGGSHKVNVVFKHPKYSFSKTVSRVEFFFFETSAYRFRVDGRKRRLSKTIIPYMSYGER